MDIARLGINVDSSDAVSAAGDLNRLGNQAQRTGGQVRNFGRTAGQGFNTAGAQADAMGRKFNASRMQTGNLAAQFNDIGVMLASGQSPFILALQQGTQVNQVLDQMGGTGRQRLEALATSFRSVVSPANLMTIAIIAGGTALAQWAISAFSAGEEATELSARMDDARDAAEALRLELRGIRLGIDETELALLDQVRASMQEVAELQALFDQNQGRGAEGFALDLNAARERLDLAQDELDAYQRQVEEKETLLETSRDMADAERALGDGLQDAARQAAVLANNMQQARNAAMEAAREFAIVQGFRSRFAGEEAVFAQEVAPQNTAGAVRNFDRLTTRQGRAGVQAQNEMLRERDRILESLKTEQEIFNDAVAQADRLLAAGVLTQDQYNQHLRNLETELNSVQFEGFERGIQSISDGIADAIVNAEDMGDAFQNVLRQMVADLISSNLQNMLRSIFNGGGGEGGLGSIFAGFFDQGGNIPAGQFGIAGERGPEVVRGPAQVTSLAATARMMGGSTNIEFKVVNNAQGVNVRQREERGPDGKQILIATVEQAAASGEMPGLESTYGLNRGTRVR